MNKSKEKEKQSWISNTRSRPQSVRDDAPFNADAFLARLHSAPPHIGSNPCGMCSGVNPHHDRCRSLVGEVCSCNCKPGSGLIKKEKPRLGKMPCRRCSNYLHDKCRPRSDGTLCTCSCSRASMYRQDNYFGVKAALDAGLPIPTLLETVGDTYSGGTQWKKAHKDLIKAGTIPPNYLRKSDLG
jgi:hypothetical protein